MGVRRGNFDAPPSNRRGGTDVSPTANLPLDGEPQATIPAHGLRDDDYWINAMRDYRLSRLSKAADADSSPTPSTVSTAAELRQPSPGLGMERSGMAKQGSEDKIRQSLANMPGKDRIRGAATPSRPDTLQRRRSHLERLSEDSIGHNRSSVPLSLTLKKGWGGD